MGLRGCCCCRRLLIRLVLFYCTANVRLTTGSSHLQPTVNGALTISDHIERLHARLLLNYDRTRVPVDSRTNEPVNVTAYMWPYDILYVKEAQGAIKISGWIDMRWRDPQLSWNPAEYGGLNETFIVRSLLWLPEIDIFYSKLGVEDEATLYGGPDLYGMEKVDRKDDKPMSQSCDHCPVHVSHDGRILRGYYFAYSFPCKVNVKYFPFDEHNCTMQLANWHMDDRFMNLYPEENSVDLTIFLANEEWELHNMTVVRTREYYNYGYFPILSYTLHIERKPFYYVCNLVVPTIILTMTALIGYHMPSAGNGMHQEKVKMGLTTILSIFILQLGVSDKLPRTSDAVPLIAVFYSCMVGLLSLAIVATSLVIVIEKQGIYCEPVPQVIRRLFRLHEVDDKEKQPGTMVGYSNKCSPGYSKRSPNSGAKCRSTTPMKYRMISDCGCHLKSSTSYQLLASTNVNGNGASPSPVRHRAVLAPALSSLGTFNNNNNNNNNNNHEKFGGRSNAHHLGVGGAAAPYGSLAPAVVAPQGGALDSRLHTTVNGMQVTHAILMEALNDLRTINDMNRNEVQAAMQKDQIRMQWMQLADRVENISLASFIVGCGIGVAMFFKHDWY